MYFILTCTDCLDFEKEMHCYYDKYCIVLNQSKNDNAYADGMNVSHCINGKYYVYASHKLLDVRYIPALLYCIILMELQLVL